VRPILARFFPSLSGKDDGGPGAERRALFLLLLGLLAWGGAFSLWSDGRELRARRDLQKKRFDDLASVVGEYRALRQTTGTERIAVSPDGEEDLLTAVSNAVASLGLRSNMLSLSSTTGPGGSGAVSVTLEGLSSDSLARFLQETERRGIYSFSADLRAVRSTTSEGAPGRTLTAVLLLGRQGP
jgi:hypothetical protein